MEYIQSRHNPVVKHIAKLLTSAKHRKQSNEAIVEGVHLVEAALASGYAIARGVISQSAHKNPEVVQLRAQLEKRSVAVITLKDSVFTSLSDVHAQVGIMAIFSLPGSSPPDTITEDAVLLEDVQDPGNIGTILRTAAAAGVTQVYLSAGCASAWSPKVLRAGMGAHFAISIFQPVDIVEYVKNSQVPVLATSLQAPSSLYEQDLRRPAAWLFGSEGQGISSQLESMATQTVIIPQANSSVESLNVAAATAVCLYEQLRQRQEK